MFSVGKLFAMAAIVALALGVARWPTFDTGFYSITIRNRGYGFGMDFWALSVGAIFALISASYYWFPIIFSRSMNHRMSLFHFWLSAIAAFSFLLLAPGIPALSPARGAAVSGDRALTGMLVTAAISTILFLVVQAIFVASLVWSAFFGETFGR
jgi:heme/copper-type cytochrome/quinol oxidase subunit 1